ncbi:MAG: type VI secretion protein ImpB [Brevundimonas sp.]|uniref:Y-family DNA polymerase n=1 Tax=Brevundimonas sp. TaxID=1871086 RepID=UPI001A2017B5|nr:type VI secretion protein ImpB [Brevundimonas sp.]MBJ7448457.1 type VI secretion protein ImpB [Brevundimonas sp.]
MEQAGTQRDDDGANLRWLFVDLNAFFASVEQQMNPDWRGRPVIVRPALSEYTGAIAASYESRPYGIRTGMRVSEARALCPGLIVAEARPDLYVQVHKQIMAEIDRHIPVWKVGSIDECSCELIGPERQEANAVALAQRIQAGIRANVGDCLHSSVGIAPSRFLAKTACGMKKPDGLTVLRAHELPGPLLDLPLSKYPGIGSRMLARLEKAGVVDTAGLWAMSGKQARAVWNSIEGERIWRGLHGLESEVPPPNPPASISHSHVLAQDMRTPAKAKAVARRLIVKCGARLRRMGQTGASVSLHLDMGPKGTPRSGRRGWETAGLHCAVAPTQDTFALLTALDGLWRKVEPELEAGRLSYVGVAVHHLKPCGAAQTDLFGDAPDQGGTAPSLKLSQALDALNRRYGKDTVSIGPKAGLPDYIGAKIAFTRIPDVEDFYE